MGKEFFSYENHLPLKYERSFPNAKVMQTCLNIEVKLESSGFLLPVLQEATHKGISYFFLFLVLFFSLLEKYRKILAKIRAYFHFIAFLIKAELKCSLDFPSNV